MFYLTLLLFFIINIYSCERLVNKNNNPAYFLGIFPTFIFLWLVPGLQNGVGVDYESYVDMYYYSDELNRVYRNGEYAFYYIFHLIKEFEFGQQGIFIVSALSNSIITLLVAFKIRKITENKYSLCLIIFLFFVVTNMFHNQMNGIRQYIAVFLFPLAYILLFEKRLKSSLLVFIFASFIHKTALVGLLFIPIAFMYISISRLKLFFIFILLPFIYFSLGGVVSFVIVKFFPLYEHYLNSDYGQALPLSSVLSRVYYLPVFLWFWYAFLHDKSYLHDLIKGLLCIWIFSFWLFIFFLDYGFFYRIAVYFYFFNIIPICFLFYSLKSSRSYLQIVLLLIYITFPYLLKVTVLARGEFLYSTIL